MELFVNEFVLTKNSNIHSNKHMKHFYSTTAIKNGIIIVAFVGLSVLFLNFNAQKPSVHISPVFTPKVNGPAAQGVGDRTGSPVGGGQACMDCHSGGSYSPTLEITVKDGGNMIVDSYLPGETYTLEYTVSAGSGSPSGYGMQSLLISISPGHEEAGNVNSVSSSNTQISDVGGHQYIEHLAASTSGIFTADWTAPAAGFGSIAVYGRGLAVNGTGNTSGDQETSSVVYSLSEAEITSISYTSDMFCKNDSDPMVSIEGETGGSFSASPMGLSIEESSGLIDIESSEIGGYTITYDYGEDSSVSFDLMISDFSESTDVIMACNSFVWIDGNTYTEDNNMASYVIEEGAFNGCDSIVSLDLTVEIMDITVTQNTDSLTANLETASYQWLDCDQNYQMIDGATDRYYKATEIGNYAVEITSGTCVDTSDCIAVTTIGIEEVAFGSQFHVYPNPTVGKIIVDLFVEQKTIDYKVLSINGQILKEGQLKNIDQIELDIEQQSGFYFLELINDEGQKAIVKLLKL